MAADNVETFEEEAEIEQSGFNFDNCIRNAGLAKMSGPGNMPKARKTGTTIVACIFNGGVVMGADARATEGDIIADKHCMKVARLTDSIYACGAGTAADLHQVGRLLSSKLTLLELNSGRKARVIAALRYAKQHLFRYQGYVGAYLLIGGVDFYGPKLYAVAAHGSSQNVPFDADGSGGLAAMGVLEANWKPNLTEGECEGLVTRALEAGMHGDLMSGNRLNYVIIRKDGTEQKMNVVPPWCKQEEKDLKYRFQPKSTTVLKSREIKFEVVESMDVS